MLNYSSKLFLVILIENFLKEFKKKTLFSNNETNESICIFTYYEIDKKICELNNKIQHAYLWNHNKSDEELLKELKEIQQIFNYAFYKGKENIIEQLELKLKKINNIKSKMNVTFFVQETSGWANLETVWKEFSEDLNCKCNVVYIPFAHKNASKDRNHFMSYKNMGINVIKHNEYDLASDSPDIVFFMKPYDLIPPEYYITAVKSIINRCVYIPYAFFDVNMEHSIKYGFKLELHDVAWKIIGYGEHFKRRAEIFCNTNGRNVAVLGHPKFDITFKMKQTESAKEYIYNGKIKNRKVIMWNTHFGITESKDTTGTFLQIKDSIFNYFENNKDVVLLWRPHPMLFNADRKSVV